MEPHTTSASPAPELSKITGPVELFKSSWRLFTLHWKILVPIALLPMLISFVGSLIQYVDSMGTSILGELTIFAGSVLSIVMMPALISTVHTIGTGTQKSLSLKERYMQSFRFFWPVVFVAFLNFFVSFGALVLFVIPLFIVTGYTCLYSYTLILEGKRGFLAFTESYHLVAGRWLPVVGRLLFLGLVSLLAWLVLAGIGVIVGLSTGMGPEGVAVGVETPPTFGESFGPMILNLIGNAIFIPITVVYMYQMFLSLKATRSTTVNTAVFKRWLVIFFIVGIIGLIAALGLGLLAASKLVTSIGSQENGIRQALEQALKNAQVPETGSLSVPDQVSP